MYGIKACIPARGHAFGAHTPITAYAGLKFCLAHAHSVRQVDIFSCDLIENTRDMLRAIGKADPDFGRAKFSPVLLTDPELLAFEAALKP